MKLIKKYLTITLIISVGAVLLLLLLNLFDSSLNSQTSDVLNKATNTGLFEEKKCAAMLGLVVDPKLDSSMEGFKQLDQIKASSQGTKKYERLFVPYEIKRIEPKEKCEISCRYSTSEYLRLKEELDQQRVFLTRFENLLNFGNTQCQIPDVVFRFPLSGYLTLARNKILEYKLLSGEGRQNDAFIGLQKMNQFFEQALLAEKYTIIVGMINISILIDVREALVSLKGPEKTALKFLNLKYEDIAQRMQTGELQITTFLLKNPLDYRVFEIFDIADGKINGASFGMSLFQSVLDKLTNYFYLPNETANDMFENLQSSVWHPCVAQSDISCESNSPNRITWIRNPVGKSLTKLMMSTSANSFRKLKSKLEALNKFTSTNSKAEL